MRHVIPDLPVDLLLSATLSRSHPPSRLAWHRIPAWRNARKAAHWNPPAVCAKLASVLFVSCISTFLAVLLWVGLHGFSEQSILYLILIIDPNLTDMTTEDRNKTLFLSSDTLTITSASVGVPLVIRLCWYDVVFLDLFNIKAETGLS